MELGYVRDGDVEILVPTVYGVESARRKVEAERQGWTTDRVFENFRERFSVPALEAVDRLTHLVMARGGLFVPGTGGGASITARLPINGKPVGVFNLYNADGKLSFYVYLGYLVDAGVSTDPLIRFAEQMSQIPAIVRLRGVAKRFRVEDLRRVDFKKYPGFTMDDVLAQPDGSDAFAQIEAALDELIRSANEEGQAEDGA